MATDFNRVIIIGRLTRDPEFKQINNTSLVNFSIANNRTYVANGEKKEEVSYFDCSAWGKLADIVKQYCKKGKQIAIEGRLQQSVWDAPDGKKNSKVRIIAENIQLLGGNLGSVGDSNAPDPQYESSYPSYNTNPSPSVPDGLDDDEVF